MSGQLTTDTTGLMTRGASIAPPLDWRVKGLWLPELGMTDEEFVAGGYSLFDGPFCWPVLVARRSALEHNIATMARYCRRHDVALAPHGKTSMAPSLFAAQLAAGAWGITVATAHQARVARRFGVPRILLANEVLDPTALRWLLTEQRRDPEFQALWYIDSLAGVEALDAALAVTGAPPSGVRVLVELGFPGGRTGCRTTDQALTVAQAAAALPGVTVAGVAGYEGGLPTRGRAREYLCRLRETTRTLYTAGLLPPAEHVVVSAGGSTYFDVVVETLAGRWLGGRRPLVLLRSGAYVTHDHGFYSTRTPFRRSPDEGVLRPALELWTQVLSVPEPGLAIAAMCRRDAPFDEGLPIPLRIRRRDGRQEPVGTALRTTALNDQHAYLAMSHPKVVSPGDLICFGISHPCTAFDKWRVIPVLDDADRVVDLLHTYF